MLLIIIFIISLWFFCGCAFYLHLWGWLSTEWKSSGFPMNLWSFMSTSTSMQKMGYGNTDSNLKLYEKYTAKY